MQKYFKVDIARALNTRMHLPDMVSHPEGAGEAALPERQVKPTQMEVWVQQNTLLRIYIKPAFAFPQIPQNIPGPFISRTAIYRHRNCGNLPS